MNEFESKLQRQPVRQLPADWRAEILAAAQAAEAIPHAATPPPRSSWLQQQLTAFFWPHPKAWAGLAAAWILILALHLAMNDTEKHPVLANQNLTPRPEVIVELKQQQKLFAELMGPREDRVADRPRIHSTPPHSFRQTTMAG